MYYIVFVNCFIFDMSDSSQQPPVVLMPEDSEQADHAHHGYHVLQNAPDLVEVVRQLRLSQGHSQQVMAEKIGISQKTMSSLERHIDRANFTRVFEVLDILGVDIVLRKRK